MPPESAKSIFAAAVERPAAEQPAFVRAACAGDEALRREVEELLAAASAAGRFLSAPTAGGAIEAVAEQSGDHVGPYRLLQCIGEGGFGVVWMAEQVTPVRRRVALKILKAGMDTGQVVARFEAERQALAMMDHPGIAKVFDAGATAAGRPFFAMELVKGVPITQFCDEAGATAADRLTLFVSVCQAVQHAHHKGVIHRDLKPSNVLVALHDGVPTPKVIDFGIAKATTGVLTDKTVFTGFRQMLGTPEYMAPEQADVSGLDVDTRADVYSLGVLLYELLTGTRPFDLRTLLAAGYAEMVRTIKEVDPPKPSTRISTLGDAAEGIAHKRRVSSKGLGSSLRGDLDWIVMKALEKERGRRYATAIALADDVLRHLHDEPVSASPPSRWYRWCKYARRHRVGVTATAIVAVTLVVGLTIALWGWGAAAEHAEIAGHARADEAVQRGLAESRAQALATAAKALQQRTDEFDLVALVVRLEEALRAEVAMQPPWPEQLAALERWLQGPAQALLAAVPRITAALAALEARALPPDETEIAAVRAAHPATAELVTLRARLRTLQRGAALRQMPAAEPELPPAWRGQPYRKLMIHTLAMTGPQVDAREDGQESESLAVARAALAVAEADDASQAEMALAWALLACGRDSEALAAGERSLARVHPELRAQCEVVLEQLRTAVRDASGDRFAARVASLRAAIQQCEQVLAAQRVWRFADDADAFLHRTLRDLADRLVLFRERTVPAVTQRRQWARRIEALTRAHPLAHTTWEAARVAVATADGRLASSRYREVPVDLQPQTGLVPIGCNPATGLWEFYDLRSAFDPANAVDPATLPIPVHAADGSLAMTPGMGIVFVLVPGGTVWIGAQADDSGAPRFDRDARAIEGPPVRVSLQPFLLARHELTQGQWQRLSGGELPSFYKIGERYGSAVTGAADNRIGELHPVEQVSWQMANELLRQHGMELPTEAQWETACRAGTDTPWWTGDDAALLEGAANVLDLLAESVQPQWGRAEGGFSDGYVGPAPVGSFLGNAWGFHDMHGNLSEWCRDVATTNAYTRRAGDGLIEATEPVRFRIVRGGGFNSPANQARASRPEGLGPEIRNTFTGVRPMRPLRQ